MRLSLLLLLVFYSNSNANKPPLEEIQQHVLVLLRDIYKPLDQKNVEYTSVNYKISANKGNYINQKAVKDFLELYDNGLLPKTHIFSAFNAKHLREAIALFKIFYFSKDYATFLSTAIWARQFVNGRLFLYSYLTALIHRGDTKDVMIPPIYEINPYYFFSKEAILEARNGTSKITSSSSNAEQSMSYYLEDVGISSYYFFYSIYYPFWMRSSEFGFTNVNRGEQYYFFHQQFLARYNLERLSNGLEDVTNIYWNLPIRTPYHSNLRYHNGFDFPSRLPSLKLEAYLYDNGIENIYGDDYMNLEDWERRLNDAFDSGFTNIGNRTKLDVDLLGNLIQANADSPNSEYYGPIWLFASRLLGHSHHVQNKNKAPSVLEHFETTTRDPVFYQIYNKLIRKFQRHYSRLVSYSREDLEFPGVKITRFSITQLVTYFELFPSDLSNVLDLTHRKHEEVPTKAYHQRLNCKPFTYTLQTDSLSNTKSVVKIFLGPKYDQHGKDIELSESRMNMVLWEYFVYDLKTGSNIITRRSKNMFYFGQDILSFSNISKHVAEGTFNEIVYQKNYFYYPSRYIVPKGSPEGTPYQFYVIIYPYVAKRESLSSKYESYYYPYSGAKQFYDSYPLGYPFDRIIRNEKLWHRIPNSILHEVKIYHEGFNKTL